MDVTNKAIIINKLELKIMLLNISPKLIKKLLNKYIIIKHKPASNS